MSLPPIIPSLPDPPSPGEGRHRRLSYAVVLATLAWGAFAAWHYHAAGLTLSHYDAKGHLVVARRILDSLTPGWKQIGAVWLPLPHLLNMLPVQVDAFYRTGASGVAISMLAFAAACWAAFRIVLGATASGSAAVLAAGLLALNPNLLYLQATPMTEPLLLAGLLVSVLALQRWTTHPTAARGAAAGVALACGCLTRYEAWPFTAAALALAALARWRRSGALARAVASTAGVAVLPALAVAGFFVLSKLSTNVWFVTDGFYVADPILARQPVAVTGAIWFGLRRLGTDLLAWVAVAAALAMLVRGLGSRDRAPVLVVLALGAVAALPWYAYYEGHPFRVRYMVSLVAAAAVAVAVLVGWLPRRARRVGSLLLLAASAALLPPFAPRAAMVAEAQWDRPNSAARAQVTTCLSALRAPGEPILASMGSLAHYMQELSSIRLEIRDFVHEGNGSYWIDAVSAPGLYVPWLLVEEQSEGGDVIAQRAARDPEYLAWFARRCQGGGVALYENLVMRRTQGPGRDAVRTAPGTAPSR
jgi:hypothetical protein